MVTIHQLLCKSFPDESYDSFRKAIDSLIELLLHAAYYVSENAGLTYDEHDAEGLKEYLWQVKNNGYRY